MTRETRTWEWEFAALPLIVLLLGALGVVLWAFTAGPWVFVALGVVGLGALVALVVVYGRQPHHPASAVPHMGHGVHRVLVVADEACSAGDLGAVIDPDSTEAFVVAPVLGSRLARWTGDERPYGEAAKHLDATVAALGELHVAARGQLGSHDPLQALEDGLREFPADEIVFVVHPESEANWLEAGVPELAQARYPIPAGTVVVPQAS